MRAFTLTPQVLDEAMLAQSRHDLTVINAWILEFNAKAGDNHTGKLALMLNTSRYQLLAESDTVKHACILLAQV